MGQQTSLSDMLEQVHHSLLNLTQMLEQTNASTSPKVAHGWVDGQEVMEALHISQRTLQTLRNNGTLGYSAIGGKLYYKLDEINSLLQNNYVMYKLSALGKSETPPRPKTIPPCPPAADNSSEGGGYE